MPKESVLMLGDTGINLNLTGDKIRADGFFGRSDGLHSISLNLEDFTGRFFIEASLETNPTENDWFPIFLDGCNPYIEYPLGVPTGTKGDTFTDAFTFEGNFIWLRARIDRSYIVPTPITDSEKSMLGSIRKVLLNH